MIKIDKYFIPEFNEIDSFILELPKLKKTQLQNAGKFALTSHFPGNLDDYSCYFFQNEKNSIGFVSKNSFSDIKIISPLLIFLNTIKDGIILIEYNSYYELIKIKDSKLTCYFRQTIKNTTKLINKLNLLITEKEESCELFLWTIENSNNIEINDFVKSNYFTIINPFETCSKKAINKSLIFCSNEKNNNFLPFILLTLLCLLFSIFLICSNSIKKNKTTKELTQLKSEYEQIKKDILKFETKNEPKIITNNEIFNQSYSPQYLFDKLVESNQEIIISSIYIQKDYFKVEGTCTNSIAISQSFSNDSNLKDIVLNQTINIENNLQKFSLSGRFIYD